METLAREIYEWCKANDLWMDITMYFNGKAWSYNNNWNQYDSKVDAAKKIDEDLYEYENRNPRDYFEYVNEPNIFSMSFEGPLYHVLNAYVPGWVRLEEELQNIFKKYGLYYELGHAWNLSAYEI